MRTTQTTTQCHIPEDQNPHLKSIHTVVIINNTDIEMNVSVTTKGSLQHISVQRDHLQVTHQSKISKKRHRIMGGLYINENSFVQLISL